MPKWVIRNLSLWLFLACVVQAFPQTSSKGGLVVELLIPENQMGEFPFRHKLQISAGHDFKKSLIGGGFALTDCVDCTLTSAYTILVYEAERLDDRHTLLGLHVSFDHRPGCNLDKEFTIDTERPATLRLRCGVKIKAYGD